MDLGGRRPSASHGCSCVRPGPLPHGSDNGKSDGPRRRAATSGYARRERHRAAAAIFELARSRSESERARKGAIHRFTMKSEDSKIYKGISRDKPGEVVPYERPVAVYIPAQYVAGTPAPFIVVQDGYNPKYHYSVPTALDNLIHQKKVPVMLAVLVHNGGGDGPGSQRGLEYDTVSGTYTSSSRPKCCRESSATTRCGSRKIRKAVQQWAAGGPACALTMAWFHPELYRRVMSYSGTFVDQARGSNPAYRTGRGNTIPR